MSGDGASFEYVCDLVRRRSGVMLDGEQMYRVRSHLGTIARRESNGCVDALVTRLRAEPNGELEQMVVEALLNNETWFFRDHNSFESLREIVFPALLQGGRRRIRVWSAACSSGQEPYSVAMILREHFPAECDCVEIYASDISARMLSRAENGLYSQLEINRGLPASMLVRYFTEEGLHWRIRPEIRRMVSFMRLDLTGGWGHLPNMDIVLLRNFLIYVDHDTRGAVLRRMARTVKPGGLLFLGSAENVFPYGDHWKVVHHNKAAFFQRA